MNIYLQRFLLLTSGICMSTLTIHAQELWTSAEMNIGIVQKLSANIEGEYRTNNNLSGCERWTASAGLEYKPLRWLKLSADYKYIHRHVESRVTKKGNIVSDYWQPRHRAGIAVTGSYRWNRFTFSLRERYQYTYHTAQTAAKWDGDDGSAKSDEQIEAKSKHILRSRLKMEYNIRKSKFTPFASGEFYHTPAAGFAYEKTRLTLGTEYKINKKHSMSAFYRYVDSKDEDENSKHVIGIGYKFKM